MILKREFIFTLILLIFPAGNYAAGQVSDYKTSSVLKEGSWTKIAVTVSGIYRISYSDLKRMGISNPADVAIYGNNAGQLSFYNDGQAPDDLKKIAIKLEKGTDGNFGEDDYLIFYAEGTHRWNYNAVSDKYEFSRHNYSDTAYYFITSKANDAVYVENYQQPVGTPDHISASHDVLFRYEKESVNLLGSGREWYQQVISGNNNVIDPGFNDIDVTENLSYKIRVLGRSDSQVSFSFKQGAETVKTLTPATVVLSDINGLYASAAVAEGTMLPSSGSPTFTLNFSNGGNVAASGWIDYVDIQARAWSRYTSGQIIAFMTQVQ